MLRSERGDALIEGVMMLAVVILVILVAIQGVFYAHARSVAQAAAQDGANAAATSGTAAGIARADAILHAAGGTGAGLHSSAGANSTSVTIQVQGHAPRIFPISMLLPSITTSATLPLERYPASEAAQ
jgi:Flp pilus assembly protein TadG